MVHKILFWSGFGGHSQILRLLDSLVLISMSLGLAVRCWQLGIEMRSVFGRENIFAFPLFAAVGGSFGYWLTGVENRQVKLLADRRDRLLEKRRRRAERESATEKTDHSGLLTEPIMEEI